MSTAKSSKKGTDKGTPKPTVSTTDSTVTSPVKTGNKVNDPKAKSTTGTSGSAVGSPTPKPAATKQTVSTIKPTDVQKKPAEPKVAITPASKAKGTVGGAATIKKDTKKGTKETKGASELKKAPEEEGLSNSVKTLTTEATRVDESIGNESQNIQQ